MMSASKSLGVADCVVFGVLTALGYLVGLYFSFARRRRLVAPTDAAAAPEALEAFLGGRSLPCVALAISVLASAVNGMNVVALIGYHYAHGFHICWVNAWLLVAAIFSALTLVPLFYNLRIATVFQVVYILFVDDRSVLK
ncbi:hypothetical protein V5799_007110 [Amblyomma americanum]|uniref:Uncharacterized protein n=1 Tax=Amblyomma americanum TaxID=6943 RepID=A0AAQ4DUH1_AMBAM